MIPRKVRKTFVNQLGPSDCGAACLYSIVRYFGGSVSREDLRSYCGTNSQGATLASLKTALEKVGFNAQGYQASDLSELSEYPHPSILHVTSGQGSFHYIILYSKVGEGWVVGDPAEGLKVLSKSEIIEIWQSKVFLKIHPENVVKSTVSSRNWLLPLLQKGYAILAIALGLGAVVGVMNLLQAVVMQQLIDKLLPQEKLSAIYMTMSLLTMALLGRSFLNYLRNYLLLSHHISFNRQLIFGFIKKLFRLPISFFKTRTAGELIARISDSKKIQKVIQLLIGSFIIDIMVTGCIAWGVAWYSWTLAMAVVGLIVGLIVLLILFNGVIYQAHRKVMVAYGIREGIFIETIENMEPIHCNEANTHFYNRAKSAHNHYQDQLFSLGKINLWFGLGSELFGVLLIMIPIFWGFMLVSSEQLMLGEWVAILFLLSGIAPAVSRLVTFHFQLKEARVAFQRLNEIWSLPIPSETIRGNAPVDIFDVKMHNLSFGHPGQPRLWSKLSFVAKRGELTVIKGNSGSGKSTLLELIQRHFEAEIGAVQVNGLDIKQLDLSSWRRLVSIVPQRVSLFESSLAENITLEGTKNDVAKVTKFCKELGFHGNLGALAEQYHHKVGKNGLSLSGGEAQLIAWARALYREPQVLLLDEATSSLDIEKKAFVMRLLQELKHSKVILMVSHDPQVIQQADQIICLDRPEGIR